MEGLLKVCNRNLFLLLFLRIFLESFFLIFVEGPRVLYHLLEPLVNHSLVFAIFYLRTILRSTLLDKLVSLFVCLEHYFFILIRIDFKVLYKLNKDFFPLEEFDEHLSVLFVFGHEFIERAEDPDGIDISYGGHITYL
jgi:hypothetical protein